MFLADALPDERDPFVLIRRGQRAGDDREIAGAAEQTRRFVGQRVRDSLGGRLVHEEVARVRLRVGVPCQHADATFARLPKHGRDRGAILDGDRDDVDAACNPVLDQLVLLRGVEARRAVPDQIDAELLRRLLGAGAAAHEIGISFGLGHDGDDGTMRPPRRRHGRARSANVRFD